MGTIAEKLIYLNETKAAIRAAIAAKGGVVTDATPFREYAALIRAIKTDGTDTDIDTDTEAVAYIYGTPSASGNVAAQYAEGYVKYTGDILPLMPAEWDPVKHPYAIILYGIYGGSAMLYFSSAKFSRDTQFVAGSGGFSTDYTRYKFYADTDGEAIYYYWNTSENAWIHQDYRDTEFTAGELAFDYTNVDVVWANFDVLNYGSTTVHLAKSDPIPLVSAEPVSAIVTHEGVEFPPFPERDVAKYPNIFIRRALGSAIFYYAFGKFTPSQTLMSDGEYEPTVTFPDGYLSARWDRANDEWVNLEEKPYSTYGAYQNEILWTNVDIYTMSGDLTIAASDAINIYKAKGELPMDILALINDAKPKAIEMKNYTATNEDGVNTTFNDICLMAFGYAQQKTEFKLHSIDHLTNCEAFWEDVSADQSLRFTLDTNGLGFPCIMEMNGLTRIIDTDGNWFPGQASQIVGQVRGFIDNNFMQFASIFYRYKDGDQEYTSVTVIIG